jgi:hypothetical protein
VHTALLVWFNILPSHKKNQSSEGEKDRAQDHGGGIEKTVRILRHRIAVSKFKGSSATLERKDENPQSELHSNGCCSAILEVPFCLGPVDGKEGWRRGSMARVTKITSPVLDQGGPSKVFPPSFPPFSTNSR